MERVAEMCNIWMHCKLNPMRSSSAELIGHCRVIIGSDRLYYLGPLPQVQVNFLLLWEKEIHDAIPPQSPLGFDLVFSLTLRRILECFPQRRVWPVCLDMFFCIWRLLKALKGYKALEANKINHVGLKLYMHQKQIIRLLILNHSFLSDLWLIFYIVFINKFVPSLLI